MSSNEEKSSQAFQVSNSEIIPTEKAYCDECKPLKHWASVVPYVDVSLCPRHAAAPALYAALRELVEFCDDPDGSSKPETLAEGLARMLPDARKALALAEGKSK